MSVANDSPAVAPNLKLALNALDLQRRYGVILHLGPAAKPLKIHYEAKISNTEPAASGFFRLLVHKEQVYINNQVPDLITDKMADDFGKVLYPLVVEISRQGRFRAIGNGSDIRARWAHAFPQLSRYYTGPVAQRALSGMQAALSNDAFLNKTLGQDWLFTLLCAPVYGRYQSYEATAELLVPLIAYQPPVRYALRLELAGQHTESGFLRVTATGHCADLRRSAEIIKGVPVPTTDSPPATGTLSLEYLLYPQDGTLFSVTGEITLALPEEEKRVEVELYQLNPRAASPQPAPKTASVLLVEEAPKKRSWPFFFK